MTEAEQIQFEVLHQADMLNGRIVAELLMADSAKCRCCQFIADRTEFNRLLQQYSYAKIEAHRYKRRFYDDYHDEIYFHQSPTQLERSWIQWWHESQMLKMRLDAMQPCYRCRLKYNPTGKSKFMGKRFWGWDGVTYIGRQPILKSG